MADEITPLNLKVQAATGRNLAFSYEQRADGTLCTLKVPNCPDITSELSKNIREARLSAVRKFNLTHPHYPLRNPPKALPLDKPLVDIPPRVDAKIDVSFPFLRSVVPWKTIIEFTRTPLSLPTLTVQLQQPIECLANALQLFCDLRCEVNAHHLFITDHYGEPLSHEQRLTERWYILSIPNVQRPSLD